MIKKRINIFWIGCIIGIIAFISIYGINVLNPSYDDWILQVGDDLACEYTGWLFFRESDWSFPLGKIDGLLYPFSTSIIYNDSIPLFAFIFKIFESILPETFQYHGFWGLFSLMLQGGISAVILQKLIKNKLVSSIGVIFFVYSPLVLHKLYGHSALGGGLFIILLAILMWVYKDEINSTAKRCLIWSGIGLLCVLVHAYYLPMVFCILFFLTLYEFIIKKNNIKKSALLILLPLSASIIFMWVFGVFSNEAVDMEQYAISMEYGKFSANLNTFFNPFKEIMSVSTYFKGIPYVREGEYEGFSYLGLGIFLLLVFNLAIFLNRNFSDKRNKSTEKIKDKLKTILKSESLYIVLCVLALILMACSPQITFNSKVLFTLKIPTSIQNIFNIFFANGRLIWPVWYVIVIIAIYLTSKNYKTNMAALIILICSMIQISDIAVMIQDRNVKAGNIYELGFNSKAWDEITFNKKHIFLMDKFTKEGGYDFVFENFAVRNGLTINDSDISKKDNAKIENFKKNEWSKVLNGEVDSEKIYVFNKLPQEIINKNSMNIYYIDGKIIGCKNELKNSYDDVNKISKENVDIYLLGEKVDFTISGIETSAKYKLSGWYMPEPQGTWTSDENALISLGLKEQKVALDKDFILNIEISDVRRNVTGKIVTGKVIVNNVEYDIDLTSCGMKNFRIPKEVLKDGIVEIKFITNGASSPYMEGEGADERMLGFMIKSIQLIQE